MFCDGRPMQLSAANLLLAAQQATKQAPQAQPNAKAFSAALADHTKGTSFAPLDFKQTASPPAAQPAASKSPAPKLGGQIDIRI
jgi:hypothetical protein